MCTGRNAPNWVDLDYPPPLATETTECAEGERAPCLRFALVSRSMLRAALITDARLRSHALVGADAVDCGGDGGGSVALPSARLRVRGEIGGVSTATSLAGNNDRGDTRAGVVAFAVVGGVRTRKDNSATGSGVAGEAPRRTWGCFCCQFAIRDRTQGALAASLAGSTGSTKTK